MFRIVSAKKFKNYKEILDLEKNVKERKEELERKEKSINEACYYKDEVEKLKKEIRELKLDKELEIKEIEHLVKMKEEKNSIELDKRKIELEKEYVQKETVRTDEYLKKVLSKQEEVSKDIKDLTNKVLDRFTVNLSNMPGIQEKKW